MQQCSKNKMISKAYEKADFQIIEFSLEDVLTKSSVVHTTAAPTTLPGTTQSGVQSGSDGDANIYFDPSDIF